MPGPDRLNCLRNAELKGHPFGLCSMQTPDHLKTETAEEAFNPDGLAQRSIALLKDTFPDLEVSTCSSQVHFRPDVGSPSCSATFPAQCPADTVAAVAPFMACCMCACRRACSLSNHQCLDEAAAQVVKHAAEGSWGVLCARCSCKV